MNEEDLVFLGVARVSAALRARRISSEALTRAYLRRIERLAPGLGCFATVTGSLALAEAQAADRELAAGRWRGPLHGIPYGLKDLLDTRGIPTTWGARPMAGHVPDRDAALVERLREAGAVLLGKLSMIELAGALGSTTAHASSSGPCRTPWDGSRAAGGSSSGSACAAAAGLVAFAIGSETLSSLTTPAAFCGATALRPTFGLVSRRGAMPYAWSLDVLGPLARSAADCALVLAALVGQDPADRDSVAAPPGTLAPAAAPGRMKAAVLGMPAWPPVAPAAQAAWQAALAVLRDAGLTLEQVELPDLPCAEVAALIARAESFSVFEEFVRAGRHRLLQDPAHATRRPEDYPPAANAADYVTAMRLRTLIQRTLADLLSRFDVIVSPNTPYPAPPLEATVHQAPYATSLLADADNLAGLPCVAVPMGFVPPGRLPVSIQFVGRPFEDGRLLSLAELFQARTSWHLERPPLG